MEEDRYDTIGDILAGNISSSCGNMTNGNVNQFVRIVNDILFVVYTERTWMDKDRSKRDVTRLISARFATSFERELYYGKCE